MSVLTIAQNITYDLQVTIGGSDVSAYVVSFTFRETLGQKATATLVLCDKDSNNLVVRPGRFGPGGGANELHPHNMSTTTTVSVIIDTCGVLSEYPTWLIADVNWGPDGLCTVELEDFHALLEPDGINMDDILAEAGDRVTAREAIAEMATAVSLSSTISFTDYDINELRRSQGSRLKWILDLCRPYQAFTQFRGSRLYVEAPRYSGSDWELTDYLNLTNISFRETTSGHKNRFRASRLQPGVNRIVGEARGDSYGRNGQTTAEITPSSRVLQCYKKILEKGVLTNFTAFDEANQPVSTSADGNFVAHYPIIRVEFTFEPVSSAFDLDTVDAQFHVYFTGASGQPVFDTEFNDTYNLSAEQTYYGVREEFTVLEDAIWPDKATATAAATNMAIENADQRILSSWASWLNPRVRAGTRVSITDWTLRQSASTWLVRSAEHTITQTTATMAIGCSRRRS